MRLGELLVEDGLTSPERLDEALSRQILHGGRLGSNLVELGYVSMEPLALALGRQHGKPAALQAHFSQIDPDLVAMLTPEMAASWHAVPLGRTGPNASHVAIATTDPFFEDLGLELQSIFGAEIVQAISPELRLLYWLEQVYGIGRTNRFKRVNRPADDFQREETDPDRRGYVQTISDVEEVTSTSHLARVAVKRIAVPLSGEADMPLDAANLESCMRSIRQATGRGKLAEIVTHLLEHGFDEDFSAAMLMTVRDELAIGWRGFVRRQADKTVDALAVPLLAESMLRGPCTSGEPLFGMPDNTTVIDQRFWQFLGAAPKEIAILPVPVLGDVACLLYVQSDGPIPPEHAGALGELSRAISSCLTRLIRAASR